MSTEDSAAQSFSPLPERSSPKKSRYEESSSEDDDYYSNFDKMLARNKKVLKKNEQPKNNIEETKEASPRLVSSSDSDSDVEEVKEDNTLEALLKKGKKFNEDREKKKNAEFVKINQLAHVDEAEVGAQPGMYYCDPHATEAENRLRRLKEDRRAAFERRSLDTGYVDLVVIDKSGRERTERDFSSPGASNHNNRKGPEVTFLLQDLHKNDTKIEKLGLGASMRTFVERISKRWECKESEVVLTLEGNPVTELDLSPSQLNVPVDGIHTISAVFVPAIHVKKGTQAAVVERDPNMIAIKFQSGEGKPAMIEMGKNTSFSEMLGKVAEALKMESIGRMVFDNEKIDFSSTPMELDMDDEDCMDVYAV